MYSLGRVAARRSLRAAIVPARTARLGAVRSVGGIGSTTHDNDPEVLEREKQRNLSGKQHTSSPHEHAPGWNEHLASASEAAVKADSSDHVDARVLQRKTVDYVQARHSPEDRAGASQAFDDADSVSGPLSGKGKNDPSPHGHAPGWNEGAASHSEAAVKADHADHSNTSPEQLQKETVEHVHSNKSPETQRYEAHEEKDVTIGPLSDKGAPEVRGGSNTTTTKHIEKDEVIEVTKS